jgi:hypothetical protein
VMRVRGLGTRIGMMKLGEGLTDVEAEPRGPRRFNGKTGDQVRRTWPARVNVELLIQHVGLSVRAGSLLRICAMESPLPL